MSATARIAALALAVDVAGDIEVCPNCRDMVEQGQRSRQGAQSSSACALDQSQALSLFGRTAWKWTQGVRGSLLGPPTHPEWRFHAVAGEFYRGDLSVRAGSGERGFVWDAGGRWQTVAGLGLWATRSYY